MGGHFGAAGGRRDAAAAVRFPPTCAFKEGFGAARGRGGLAPSVDKPALRIAREAACGTVARVYTYWLYGLVVIGHLAGSRAS